MPLDPVQIGLYYDFSSVVCFAAHRVVSEIEPELAQRAIEIEWLAVDLTVMTGWQRGDRMSGRRNRSAYQTVEQLVADPVVHPAVWMDSRRAGGIALFLAESGAQEVAARWRRCVFDSVFLEGRSLAQEHDEWLDGLAKELGFTPCSRVEAVRLVEHQTRAAIELGVVGVPSFLLGHYPVGGIQEPATMVTFLSRYAAKVRSDPELAF